MFTLNFGKDKTLDASAVEERYARVGEQTPVTALVLEAGPVTEELSVYVAMFSGDVSPLRVLCGGEKLTEYSGYTDLADLSIRLTSGGKMLSVTLKKSEAAAEE